jgi:Tfp pilus assembly protein PilW
MPCSDIHSPARSRRAGLTLMETLIGITITMLILTLL